MSEGAVSPRTGDLVRAQQDRRDGRWVQGILHLRYVPTLDYVQVVVDDGTSHFSVSVDTIEVLRRAMRSPDEVDADDPLRFQAVWRPVTDLHQAEREGLLQPTVGRAGGSWADLVRELRLRIDALIEAGWVVVSGDTDESWEHGDSVCFDLERRSRRLNAEYYEHGVLDVYEIIEGEEYDPGDPHSDPAPPVLTIEGSDPDVALAAFRSKGWVP